MRADGPAVPGSSKVRILIPEGRQTDRLLDEGEGSLSTISRKALEIWGPCYRCSYVQSCILALYWRTLFVIRLNLCSRNLIGCYPADFAAPKA